MNYIVCLLVLNLFIFVASIPLSKILLHDSDWHRNDSQRSAASSSSRLNDLRSAARVYDDEMDDLSHTTSDTDADSHSALSASAASVSHPISEAFAAESESPNFSLKSSRDLSVRSQFSHMTYSASHTYCTYLESYI